MFKKPVDEIEKPIRPRPSLTPSAYISPRPVPKVPSLTSSIRSVFASHRKSKGPAALGLGSSASASALSLRSGDFADNSQITSIYSHSFALNETQSMPIVSSRDATEEEAECPVCLEPLSFSFRLPGEKPHIVPECGHSLHEVLLLLPNLCALNFHALSPPQACFTAVYGPPPGASRVGVIRNSNLGVCGVCRRPMKVGDGDGGKSNSAPFSVSTRTPLLFFCSREWCRARRVDWHGRSQRRRIVSRARNTLFDAHLPSGSISNTTTIRPE